MSTQNHTPLTGGSEPPDKTIHPPQQGLNNVPQREAAAHVARQHINQIYEHNPPNQLKAQTQNDANPYQRTHNTSYDWQQYHTAWQQYYQQYYHRYYLQQLHTQRQQQASSRADSTASISHTVEEIPPLGDVKDDLLHKIKQRAKEARRSHHFMPVISALVIGVIFIFLQYNRVFVANVKAYVSPGSSINESDTVLVDPAANLNVGPEPELIIPKINVDIRVVYDVTSLENDPVQEGLKRGVVHYKLPGANSLPGQIGNTVLLGHSSNDVFDPGNYKFAFVLLDRLQQGDIFYIHYESKRYVYRVSEKKIIKPSELNALHVGTDKPMATLITCTPLGTATNRLLVFAEQISPDPNAAKALAPEQTATDESITLPGNSPTFFERIRSFFF